MQFTQFVPPTLGSLGCVQLKGVTENRPRAVGLCGDSANSLVLQAFGWSPREQYSCEVNVPHWLTE